jgi:hypothetical protein
VKRDSAEISIKGKVTTVPALGVNDTTIVATGRWLKTAIIKDEFWVEGDVGDNPESIITRLKDAKFADIFTFSQKPPSTEPRYNYYREWGNLAVIRLTTFDDWWERLPQEARKNVRRAGRRGVVVRRVEFGDDLVKGIVAINNETPIRQGRPFWHYGKSFETVKKDYSDFLDRSEFIGAYYQDELIGFIRLIYMGEIVSVLQLLNKNAHYDKRPANVLIAEAVKLCVEKGAGFLVYGQYVYDGNTKSPLTEFKRRNGFEQVLIPTYYVPLTLKGRISVKLRLHLGIKRLVPQRILLVLRDLRAKILEKGRLGKRSHIEVINGETEK